jgi:hypothetical protein
MFVSMVLNWFLMSVQNLKVSDRTQDAKRKYSPRNDRTYYRITDRSIATITISAIAPIEPSSIDRLVQKELRRSTGARH